MPQATALVTYLRMSPPAGTRVPIISDEQTPQVIFIAMTGQTDLPNKDTVA